MAQPPRFRRFAREDFPDAPAWLERLFLVLNETVGGLVEALEGRLTRSENLLSGTREGIVFATNAEGAPDPALAIAHGLPVRPRHCWVTRLERVDGAPITDAWSMTWALDDNNALRLSLQGLTALTRYRMSIAFE